MKSHRDPLKAGLLAAVLPGAGHLYAGNAARGLVFFLGVATGLFLFIVPGVVIWSASVADAVLAARRRNAAAPRLELEPEVSPLQAPAISDAAPLPPPRREATGQDRPTAPRT